MFVFFTEYCRVLAFKVHGQKWVWGVNEVLSKEDTTKIQVVLGEDIIKEWLKEGTNLC